MNIQIIKDDKNIKQYLPIFATKEFLETKSNEYGWFVSDEFILSYYIDRRFIFSKLVFTNETIYLSDNIDNEKEFLNQVVNLSKDLDIDFISQPLANCVFAVVPDNSKFISWGSYVVDLTVDEETIMKNIHSKHRNVIKKAKKDGVVIEVIEDIEIIYNNIKETMQRQNRAYPSLESLEKIKKFTTFFIAKKDDEIQGCSVVPYNQHQALYLYGGSISRPYTGSLNLMHYEAMLYFKKNGVKQYDFMGARPNVEKGSKLEGIQRFKSRFTKDMREGYMWKYEVRPLKVKLMNLLQILLSKSKGKQYLGDAIEQELSR